MGSPLVSAVTGPDVAAAVLDRLNAALDVGPYAARAWEWDVLEDVPKRDMPHRHVVIHISERAGVFPLRGCGRTDRRGWRVVTRAAAPNVDTVRALLSAVDAALRFATITVNGENFGPVQLEAEDTINRDETAYSGATVWTL